MKKLKQKNQIIVTVLALMIAVSGYLHFATKGGEDIEKAIETSNEVAEDTKIETTIGEISTQDIEKENAEGKAEVKKEDKSQQDNDKKEEEKIPDSSTIGQAVLVNTTINADYFYSAKLSREQIRAKNTETLMQLVNNDKLSKEQKDNAMQEVIAITKKAEMENTIENLLAAKGFENCVVSVNEKSADVVVDISQITLEQAAVIEDVVIRKTGFSSGDIVITPTNGQ